MTLTESPSDNVVPSTLITHGIAGYQRFDAAKVFYQAFQRKLSPLLGGEEGAVEIIADNIDPERCIAAIADNRVVGIAGLSYGGRRFANFRRTTFIRRFGLVAGYFRYVTYAAFNVPDAPGEIVIDGLAVEEASRGQGVGTRLLEATFQHGLANRMSTVKLTVVDTNPEARRLYERLGFTAVKTRSYPDFMAHAAGFSQEITMVKKLTK